MYRMHDVCLFDTHAPIFSRAGCFFGFRVRSACLRVACSSDRTFLYCRNAQYCMHGYTVCSQSCMNLGKSFQQAGLLRMEDYLLL